MNRELIEKWKKDKNLHTNLGIRLEANEMNYLNGSVFGVIGGYLYVDQSKIESDLAAMVLRFLEEEMPLKNLWSSYWLKLDFEEVFMVIGELGIVSIRQIGTKKIGNSRFWAKKLRKYLDLKPFNGISV